MAVVADDAEQRRSLKDVNTVLQYAKLEPSEIRPCVQTVFFSENLDNDTVKLLEINGEVLNALKAGDRVVIRGNKDDFAVLCTEDQTFDLKGAELSNSMLLLQHLDFGQDLPDDGPQEMQYRKVISVLHDYFELRPITPRLQLLRQLLEENLYSGWECEEDEQHQGKKYTMANFLNMVQASEQEIKTGLKNLKAFELNDYWRMLDFDYLSTVMSHIVQLAEESDWLQTGVPFADCLAVLEELFPREVIKHIVQCYSKQQPGGGSEESDIYQLDEDKVCQFYAEVCLRNAGKFNLNEFLQVWEQSVPLGMITNLSQIQGIALVDRETKPETITFFPVEDLPEGVSERFDCLFEARKKWTLAEITPYISDLTTEKLDVGALLTKYSRASTYNGVKVFSSRKTS